MRKAGRPPLDEARKKRGLYLTDTEYQIFLQHLGPGWVRDQIDKIRQKLAGNKTN